MKKACAGTDDENERSRQEKLLCTSHTLSKTNRHCAKNCLTKGTECNLWK